MTQPEPPHIEYPATHEVAATTMPVFGALGRVMSRSWRTIGELGAPQAPSAKNLPNGQLCCVEPDEGVSLPAATGAEIANANEPSASKIANSRAKRLHMDARNDMSLFPSLLVATTD